MADVTARLGALEDRGDDIAPELLEVVSEGFDGEAIEGRGSREQADLPLEPPDALRRPRPPDARPASAAQIPSAVLVAAT